MSTTPSTGPSVTVIAAIWQREKQWANTLESLYHWNGNHTPWLDVLLREETRTHKYRNPGVLYNSAAAKAQGDILFLTNPENLHIGPVLEVARRECREGNYVVFGCRPMNRVPDSFAEVLKDQDSFVDTSFRNGWYQHSKHRNACLHFASAIHRQDWARIGGFDAEYDKGHAWEDNDLVMKILAAGIKIQVIDDPYVMHQPHDRPERTEELAKLEARNAYLYQRKWSDLARPMEHEPRMVPA